MRHERNFGVEIPSLKPYPPSIRALIWVAVLAVGALFWWGVANLMLLVFTT